jgi:hypothetical protein
MERRPEAYQGSRLGMAGFMIAANPFAHVITSEVA